ncbi:MAG: BatD family protein [Saprospiraceae bacterium]|nr:BatD family protein [Saprospiraceae bacterium]
MKRIPAATPPAVIQVQPLPQPAPASFSGAVGHYSAVFGASLNDLTTDDALSLTIAVNGDGDIKRLQAPPIDFPESFEVYPPKVLEDRTYEENGRIMGKKVFEYILVPREAGIFTITPAFVYFDIDSAKYATVSADPITLNVRQGQSNRSGVAPTEIQNADAEIMPLKALSTRGAYHFSLWGTHWLWIGLVLPLLAVCTAWLLKRRRQSVEGRNSLEYHSQRARKTAIARLSTAKAHLDAGQSRSFYDEIEKGLIAYLGYKFDIPPAAWSKTLARQRMEEAGVDAALVAAFSQVIQTCEMALFAAKDQATDMQATYSAAADIIEKLET